MDITNTCMAIIHKEHAIVHHFGSILGHAFLKHCLCFLISLLPFWDSNDPVC